MYPIPPLRETARRPGPASVSLLAVPFAAPLAAVRRLRAFSGAVRPAIAPRPFRTLSLLMLALAACLATGCTSVMQRADDAFMTNDFSRAHGLYMQTWQEPKAQYRLALMHLDGQGVPQNDREALKWMGLAAQNDYPPALRDMGEWFMNGRIVPLNPAQGARYLDRAARLGDGKAMYLLGLAYRAGLGVPQNAKSARTLFRNAQKAGYHVPPSLLGE